MSHHYFMLWFDAEQAPSSYLDQWLLRFSTDLWSFIAFKGTSRRCRLCFAYPSFYKKSFHPYSHDPSNFEKDLSDNFNPGTLLTAVVFKWVPRTFLTSNVCMHYSDVIMSPTTSQITSLTIMYLIVYSGTDQIKHQSSASLAFVQGIHRRPVSSPHKWPVTRKMFPFDDIIMEW